MVAERKRILFYNLLNVFYGIGMFADTLAFNWIKDWKTVFIFVFILPAFLVLVSIHFILQKTPMDLIKHEEPEKIVEILGKI